MHAARRNGDFDARISNATCFNVGLGQNFPRMIIRDKKHKRFNSFSVKRVLKYMKLSFRNL